MRILLRDLTPATLYALQLRSVAGEQVSDWSRVFNITTSSDVIAPKKPVNVIGSMSGTSFNLKWDAVTLSTDNTAASDLEYYQVFVQSSGSGITGTYITKDTQFEFSFSRNLALFGTPQANVQMAVQAVDKVGNTDGYTTFVSQTNAAPSNVTGLVATSLPNAISGSWTPVTDSDLQKYIAYVGTTSGFTPGSGNKVWEGVATSFEYSTIAYATDQWIKVVAVDVFGTSSVTPASAGPVRPSSPTSVDATAPGVPAGLTASLANATDESYAIATVSWTAVTDTDNDLAEYIIGYRPTGASDWQYVKVDYTNTSTKINGLLPYTNYDFRIRSSDFSANLSNWSSTVVATAASNAAPSTPTAPTVVSSTMRIQVNIPHTKAAGGAMEGDVTYYEVYASTTTGFTPAAASQIGTLAVGPAIIGAWPIPASGGTSTQTWFVKIIAVDRGGLKSAASAQATSTPGLIDSANIVDLAVTNAKINDLAANKITAGTGFVNDLTVKSKFTLGDASTTGSIESFGYVAGTTGLHIDKTLIEINTGTIRAGALAIQDSQNIVRPEFAGFEFVPTFYTGKITVSGNNAMSFQTGTPKYGTQVIRFTSNGVGVSCFNYFGTSSADYNTSLEEGETYILSGWARSNVATVFNFSFRLRLDNATFVGQTVGNPTTSWTRFSQVLTIPAGVTSGLLMTRVDFAAVGDYLEIDGFQLERKIGNINTPSPWTPPGVTSVDGGIIRTGEIRSTSTVTVNSVSQPAWSINMSGGAQFGDVNVRGSLIVGPDGADTDAGQSFIASGNYVTNTTGWKIDSTGAVDFNSGRMRGGLIVDGTLAASKLALGVRGNNLIADPSFEDAQPAANPTTISSTVNTTGWYRDTFTGGGGLAELRRFRGRSGSWSAAVSTTGGGTTTISSNILPVTPGSVYKLAFYAVTTNALVTATYAVLGGATESVVTTAQTLDPDFDTTPTLVVETAEPYDPNDYALFSFDYTVPVGINFIRVRLGCTSVATTGTVVFDDVSVVLKGTTASELTPAGLRLFDIEGSETGAFVSNRPNYFTVSSGGSALATIDSLGNISGASGTFIGDADNPNLLGDAPSALSVGGMDYADRLYSLPQGILAQVYRSSLVSITNIRTEYGIYECAFSAIPGRHYRILFYGGTVRVNTGAPAIVAIGRIRRTLDGSTPSITNGDVIRSKWTTLPTNNVDQSLMPINVQGEMTGGSGGTTPVTVRLLYTLNALNAGATDWISFSNKGGTSAPDPIEVIVEDLGVDVPDVYQANSGGGTLFTGGTNSEGGGTPATVKKTYTTTWYANSSQTRRGTSSFGNNTVNTSAPTGYNLAGYYSSSNGRQYSYYGFTSGSGSTFTGPTISTAISGATVTKVELYVKNATFYNNAGGSQQFGLSTLTGMPSSGSASSTVAAGYTANQSFTWGQGKWITLPTGAGGISTLTGGGRVIVIGPGTSNSNSYYSKWYDHVGSGAPQLRITYTK